MRSTANESIPNIRGYEITIFHVSSPLDIGGKAKLFYISRTKHLSWDNAALYCKERGMNLATFDSYNEALYYDGSSKYSSWVGVRDRKQNGEFLRITDDKNIRNFIPWRISEPSTTEYCVHAWDDFSFNDINCDFNFRFGCEAVLPTNDQECKESVPRLTEINTKLLAEVFTSFSTGLP